MKFIVTASTADGHISFQTLSAERALEKARNLNCDDGQHVRVTDMNGREYEPDAFDQCFVRRNRSA